MNTLTATWQRILWRVRDTFNIPTNNLREIGYRIGRLPDKSKAGGVFPFPWGHIEYLSPSDIRGQFGEIFLDRHYAVNFPNSEPTIIDAGGNIGMSAIWFKREYPAAKLTVYEADPKLAALIQRNLGAASITGVKVNNAAVWTHDGHVTFDNLGEDKGSVSSSGTIKVPSIDLALHLPPIVDLLKLDIEGAEYPLIDRLCQTGAIAQIRNLVAEFHIRRTDTDVFLSALQQLGRSGMQVSFTSALGSCLGRPSTSSPMEIVHNNHILAQVYAWR